MSDFAIKAINGSFPGAREHPDGETSVVRERQNRAEGGKDLPHTTVKQTPTTEAKHQESDFSSLFEDRSTELQFQASEIAKRTLIIVRDTTSGDIVRQIPSKAVIAIATYLAEVSPDSVRDVLIDDVE